MESSLTPSDVAGIVRTVVMVVGVLFAAAQLYYVTRSFRLNAIVNFTRLEADLAGKKARFSEAMADADEADLLAKREIFGTDRIERERIAESRVAAAREDYLNTADRLAFCLLYGFAADDQDDYQKLASDYEGYLSNIVKQLNEEDADAENRFPNPETAYRHIYGFVKEIERRKASQWMCGYDT